MVSQRAQCEALELLGGEDGKAGLREGTGKIICLKVPHK